MVFNAILVPSPIKKERNVFGRKRKKWIEKVEWRKLASWKVLPPVYHLNNYNFYMFVYWKTTEYIAQVFYHIKLISQNSWVMVHKENDHPKMNQDQIKQQNLSKHFQHNHGLRLWAGKSRVTVHIQIPVHCKKWPRGHQG